MNLEENDWPRLSKDMIASSAHNKTKNKRGLNTGGGKKSSICTGSPSSSSSQKNG